MLKLVLAAALCMFSAASVACIKPRTPDAERLSNYSAVFVGEVTGIHLASYEAHLLKTPGHFYPTSSTADYTADVVVVEMLQGEPATLAKLHLGGCRVGVPALKQRGIFFVLQDGVSAIPVWDSDSISFSQWLSVLAKARGDR